MSFKRLFPLVLLQVFLLAGVGGRWARAQEPKNEVPEPYRTFFAEAQKRVAEFPLVPVGTTPGKYELFTMRLDAKPVVVDSHRFGCVRFVVPEGAAKDMVWAFSTPPNWGHWFILPASGEMQGFRDWINADRLYEGLPATRKNPAHLQSLSAASFKPGQTYILWFEGEGENEGPPMLAAAINFLEPGKDEKSGEAKRWDAETIDKGLGLKPVPAADQVAYYQSRGGKILLDSRFFRPAYARERIENLLFTRRQTMTSSDGFFITVNVDIPVCGTDPALADVVAAYGEPDLVLTPEQRRIFDEKAPKGESAYYYDYMVFLVETKAGVPRIRSVTSVSSDVSAARPNTDGLTWSDAPLLTNPLRLFYRDRKEVARVAFWGDARAKLISGEIPLETFQREDEEDKTREELKYLGDTKWEYRMFYKEGQVARTGTYENYVRHGVERWFYPDGQPQVEAPYVKGVLEGVVKQWKKDGQMRERTYQAGAPVK